MRGFVSNETSMDIFTVAWVRGIFCMLIRFEKTMCRKVFRMKTDEYVDCGVGWGAFSVWLDGVAGDCVGKCFEWEIDERW